MRSGSSLARESCALSIWYGMLRAHVSRTSLDLGSRLQRIYAGTASTGARSECVHAPEPVHAVVVRLCRNLDTQIAQIEQMKINVEAFNAQKVRAYLLAPPPTPPPHTPSPPLSWPLPCSLPVPPCACRRHMQKRRAKHARQRQCKLKRASGARNEPVPTCAFMCVHLHAEYMHVHTRTRARTRARAHTQHNTYIQHTRRWE